MNRLLRISLDTLLMSTMPIIMWILLGIVVDKNIANVFTLTYPIQFVTSLILAIFGIGPNVNEKICFKFEILKNMKYVSNDIFDRLGMFIIYFIGWKNTLEFGAIYLVAINFETLIMDAQWDMSYSIITAATIDASKNKLYYRESLKILIN